MWIKHSGEWTFVADEGAKERSIARAEHVGTVSGGCTEQEFAALRCPVCKAILKLSVHPMRSVFFLACTSSTQHLAAHGEFTQKRDWHQTYVAFSGWLDAETADQP